MWGVVRRLPRGELSGLGTREGSGRMATGAAWAGTAGKASVAFVAVKENIRFESHHDLQTKVITTLFAEVERDLIPERTREGLRTFPNTHSVAFPDTPGCRPRRDRALKARGEGRARAALVITLDVM